MVLLIDNFDSFTYNLYHYILSAGNRCVIYRNDMITVEEIEKLDVEGIVFSPGPKTPTHHPLMHEILNTFATRLPILGICLGYQAIGEYYGALLEKAPLPVHGKTTEIIHHGHRAFAGIPSPFMAGRYHSLILSGLENTPMNIIAHTKENIPMAIAHSSIPIWALQFHPESVLTEFGEKIIQNWIRMLYEF